MIDWSKVDVPLEILYLAQAACRLPEICMMPTQRGNGLTLVMIPRRTINRSPVGTKLKTKDGGYLERTTDEGWVQWRHVPAQDEPGVLRQLSRRSLAALRRARRASTRLGRSA